MLPQGGFHLRVLDPQSVHLIRLFRYPGGEIQPTPEVYRKERFDAPPGKESAYATLYTTDNILAAAVECRILYADASDAWFYDVDKVAAYFVARYSFARAGVFLPIDLNEQALDLPPEALGDLMPYRQAAYALHARYQHALHGLSYPSFHRHRPGRVYAIWHSRKDDIGLCMNAAISFHPLSLDAEWKAGLATLHGGATAVRAAPIVV